MTETEPLLDHLFRRQAGRIVAHLTRLLGPAHLELAEETVQEAMLKALQLWPTDGIPDNPEGWLFRVAHNSAIDAVRRSRFLREKTDSIVAELNRASQTKPGDPDVEAQLRDDELRMIFLCCHPDIPRDSAVALSLKIVGGFSVREIARAFLADDAAIAQRLTRTKRQIREAGLALDAPAADLRRRMDAVLDVIYFIFNEGYTAHEGDELIRLDLCREALRLGRLIVSSSLEQPRLHALVALMALQFARTDARIDSAGNLIPLEEQDRTRWDQQLIALGFHHFDRSMAGDQVTQYHVEAAIAATHARGVIDWPVILHLYDQLMELNPSPVVALNRAVAVAKVEGPQAALRTIEPLEADPKLRYYYLLLAVRAHLLLQTGHPAEAAQYFRAALESRCSEPERRFLRRKLAECSLPIDQERSNSTEKTH